MSLDKFWEAIEAQLKELKSAKTADDVVHVLSLDRETRGLACGSADGFFAGSGGDDSVEGALTEAGWTHVWREAHYHYCMEAPSGGSTITYIEGDIYIGNRPPLGSN